MIVREIVRTCSNPHVAHAAVASIGGDFARRFLTRRGETQSLQRHCSPPASFAASPVMPAHAIGRESSEATRGADQPILSGLRYILEHGVELDEGDADPEMGLACRRRRRRPAARLGGIDDGRRQAP